MLAFNHLPISICFAGFDLLPFAVGIKELEAVLSEREQNGIAAEDRGSKEAMPWVTGSESFQKGGKH